MEIDVFLDAYRNLVSEPVYITIINSGKGIHRKYTGLMFLRRLIEDYDTTEVIFTDKNGNVIGVVGNDKGKIHKSHYRRSVGSKHKLAL